MSSRIEVIYKPSTQAAQLRIDGTEFHRAGSRIQQMLVGKAIDQWLEPLTRGYRQWDGFLPELATETNEERFEIVFSGSEADYARFAGEVRRQEAMMAENGFARIELELAFHDLCSPEQLLGDMRKLRRDWKAPLSDQMLSIRRSKLDALLKEAQTPEEVRQLYGDYRELIHEAYLACKNPEAKESLRQLQNAWNALSNEENE